MDVGLVLKSSRSEEYGTMSCRKDTANDEITLPKKIKPSEEKATGGPGADLQIEQVSRVTVM